MIKNGSKEITTEFNNIFYCQDYNRDKFINTLKDNNILFIIKPHPFDEEIYKDKNIHSEYTNIENIKVVFNQDFENMGINLYELFQHTDMMISDYSSIALDYAILNKPIVYLDNLSQDYNKNRGFILEDNYKMFIPGIKVKNFEQLLTTIKSTTHNNQNSKILSEQIPIIHKYVDNKSCERIYKIMKGLQ